MPGVSDEGGGTRSSIHEKIAAVRHSLAPHKDGFHPGGPRPLTNAHPPPPRVHPPRPPLSPPPPLKIRPSPPPPPGMGAATVADADQRPGGRRTLVFTYGTLKQGFSNHGLVQEMIRAGEVSYVGVYRTAEAYPLVCGPYRVPFLLNLPGEGQRVWGELYAVSAAGIARMDELEGTCRDHYERLPILVREGGGENGDGDGTAAVGAEAYFAHRNYAGELWKRNGERGFCVYSEKEARGYVRRKDRPPGTTFLDQIRVFVASAGSPE